MVAVIAYTRLKQNTEDWVDSLSYVTPGIDWSDGLNGEENKMAETFWPTGTQEKTATSLFSVQLEIMTMYPKRELHMYIVSKDIL
mgnify:CR=1 FL=1